MKALADAVTRFLTKGKYSHCELVIEEIKFTSGDQYEHETIYHCFSSSVQDGGVRRKEIDVMNGKWDLIQLHNVDPNHIINYFGWTKGMKYDWWGAISVVLGIKHKRIKYFSSEWCYNALVYTYNTLHSSQDGWRFSPNDLAVIFKRG
ncbi:enoyl-CoA hydratase [Aggregatibacter actinomycetemcomitans]|uniref:enoyl-CoA hydratase n=1 Tax=Aggregatibacter actinomycetemcomitans TaxID=714 RepID=UPI001F397E5C|nr:enoyl-CoA hydratase [Aggregatibacter actinomycetemcomitans]